MTTLNTIIEEEKTKGRKKIMTDFPRAFRAANMSTLENHHERCSHRHGMLCDCAGIEMFNAAIKEVQSDLDTIIPSAIQRAHEAGELDVLERERAYWVNVFDSAPVREKEHPNDVVARNFARIEIERLDTLLSKIRS